MTKINEEITKEYIDNVYLNSLKDREAFLTMELNAIRLEIKSRENKKKHFVNPFIDGSKYKTIFEEEK